MKGGAGSFAIGKDIDEWPFRPRGTPMHEDNELMIRASTKPTSGVGRDGDSGEALDDLSGEDPISPLLAFYGSLASPSESERVANRYERHVKPALDRVLAVVLLLLLSPVFAFLALSIRCTMGRGVIFRQQRVGKNGRLFTLYKFRTMRPDRRRRPGPPLNGHERRRTHKSPFHPLVTPVGRVLRKLSVDELPQLWNVMCGQMSMVGPRPELPWIVDGYEPWQHLRHQVKPGLTGLWQVTTRGVGVMHDRTDVDLEYLERVSFRRDLSIMLRTIPVMIARRGSF
jgi:lipopolysaccharide/colanic/teichoic acid biosynthesis glycosyltransferase